MKEKVPRYIKLDDLQTLVDSTPAKVTGESSAFDFGEEGDKTVTIVTDPMKFNSTRESGDTSSSIYWGTNFMTINVDNSDQPVNIILDQVLIMQLNYLLKFKEQ